VETFRCGDLALGANNMAMACSAVVIDCQLIVHDHDSASVGGWDVDVFDTDAPQPMNLDSLRGG